jgi:hypothetical protein
MNTPRKTPSKPKLGTRATSLVAAVVVTFVILQLVADYGYSNSRPPAVATDAS